MKTFVEYIKIVSENRAAHIYSANLTHFQNWLKSNGLDSTKAEEIVKQAGYENIPAFISDSNPSKWTKLRLSGQGNYV